MPVRHWTSVALPEGEGFRVFDELADPAENASYSIPPSEKAGFIADRCVEILNENRTLPPPRSAAGVFYTNRKRRR